MTYRRHLARTEAVAIFALLVVAIVFAIYSTIRASASPNEVFSPIGTALVVFIYTLAIGFVPAAIVGAPLYAWLLYIGKASWVAAISIGLTPGLVFLLVDRPLASWAMTCGVVVAVTTHTICRPGPDNSIKPNPLREPT